MNGNIDVRRTERKAYMSFHRDGLWDIFLGALLLAWGLSMGTAMDGLGGIWFIVLFPILMGAKRRITYPRLGYAEFPRTRKALSKMVVLFTITALLGLFVFVFWTSTSLPGLRLWLHRNIVVFFGGMLAAVLCILAMVNINRRLYAHAAVVFLSFAAAQWLGWYIKYSFLISGAIVLLTGIAVLIQFLREYPLAQEEAENAAEER